MLSSEQHVLIVGAGTFGLSTGVELLRKGHRNVTILDPYPVPSPLSAGNDVNKIIQTTVEDKFYSELATESFEKWTTDPLYKPAFHETGIIYGATSKDAVAEIQRRKEILKKSGEEITDLNSPEDFGHLIRVEKEPNAQRFQNWKGYHQKHRCGWAFAALALRLVGAECVKLGAKIIMDSVEELLMDDTGTCVGVRTFSGKSIYADKVVLCAGANSIRILDFKGQLVAKCWTVGHIKLTDEESRVLNNSPVVLNISEGFFFEPDQNNELKFCNEFPGYINMVEDVKHSEGAISVPVYKDMIPKEAELQMRSFLNQVFPQLANRNFVRAKICWCTDTSDRHFLFGEHPAYKNLILGTGDSGKGFKYMPISGEYISTIVLEGSQALSSEKREAWRWRPESAVPRDVRATQGRYGGTNVVKDLKDITEWTNGKVNKL
ncbi:hypothetical protein DASC09_051930 [Saccharomycopsis crataegensis]|uniref:FAD dependent oxidoreductase domain-containing protein n=1 Tax=Saccharomycopsis crataegensis TaxID=43959 RepID=A0AAV5QSR1_9ASCO|nr:hypothetical protein DASC09_051930 [Saccharomycopsis crataegensis]